MKQSVKRKRPLSTFNERDKVIIDSIRGSGPLKKRMLEMGFIPETPLQILKYAPLYDPIEVKIKNAHISLRVAEANEILVVPVDIYRPGPVSLEEVKA